MGTKAEGLCGQKFTDIRLLNGITDLKEDSSKQVICYRNGLTVYEESFENGILCSAGWNASGYPLNVLGSMPSRLNHTNFRQPSVFRLELDGVDVTVGLRLKNVEISEDRRQARVTLISGERKAAESARAESTDAPGNEDGSSEAESPEAEITVCTSLDGTGIFSRHLEIRNLTERKISISRLSVMGGGIDVASLQPARVRDDLSKVYTLGYMDADYWGREGDFVWKDLQPGMTTVAGRYERERNRMPFFALRDNRLGNVMIAELAWSAGYEFRFDLQTEADGRRELCGTKLSFEAQIRDAAPLYVLEPGETFVSPEIEIGMIKGDLDGAVNAMNDHLRSSVLNRPEADGSALLVGAGMGAEHDMSEETTRAFMDQMAELGCEVFIIDAGWFCPPGQQMSDWGRLTGNWEYDRERYPGGIEEIRDYCHARGMKFGMWMEPERAGAGAAVRTEHPEWFGYLPDGEPCEILDLTNPECFAWVQKQAEHVIRDYGLDLFRLDYNIAAREMFFKDRSHGRENLSVRNTQAVYRLYENLHLEFPEVIFENCAGGGGRCDLGMMKYFNHTWVSDNQIPPYSQSITNGMTLALPPERVDRLVAGMNSHTAGSLAFHMRNAMLTHMTLNVFHQKDFCDNSAQMDFIRHSVSLYKEFIRPFLPTCRIYHHTPESAEFSRGGMSVLEAAAADGEKGAIAVFTSEYPAEECVTVRPRGISPSGNYRVRYDNSGAETVVSGFDLVNTGLRVRIPSALDSELILIEKV